MVAIGHIHSVKQRGFTLVELVITLVIAAIVIGLASPVIRGSIAEHKALAMVNAIKTDFEWSRNYALSSNQTIKFNVTVANKNKCEWTTTVYDPIAMADLPTQPNSVLAHQMTTAELSNYSGVACAFYFNTNSTPSPEFNGMGLNSASGTSTADDFSVTVSASGTVKKWKITVLDSGDLKVQVL